MRKFVLFVRYRVICLLFMGIGFSSCGTLKAQQTRFDLFRLAQTSGLTVQNRSVTPLTDDKRKGIRFSAHEGDGVAWINEINFSDGIIEVDIRGKDVLQQSFVGIAFHGINKDSLEAVYFRPFNFRSTDSLKKSHAVEYVFHPDYPWERLRKEHPGEYEKSVIQPPVPDQWFHVKIVIHYPEIKVYLNGNTDPCLAIRELNTRRAGKVGLWVGNNSDGDFANLTINNL
jgi:hypothetical protein